MNIKDYWLSLVPSKKKALAEACGTSVSYLSNIFNGHRMAGIKMAKALHKETRGKVSKRALRPDD